MSPSPFTVNGEETQKVTLYEEGIYEIVAGESDVKLSSYGGGGGVIPKLVCPARQEVSVEVSFRGKEKLGGGGTLAATEVAI